MDKLSAIIAIGVQILGFAIVPALGVIALATHNNNNNNIVPHGEHAVYIPGSSCVIKDVERSHDEVRGDVLFCWNMLLEEEE
jgi:hypothetical protein